ncbi:NUDIX hydrolase [Afifella sp. IM 167]|uniref:NUDIX hydrolase n=1 Tax=Afifella sp. IM 167 TaxID=2033586 RepID=UPI001CCEC707|nr:NUDIX hydrolase [Afifella sp. IM 167]MBZ8132622.1 NUDIX hydrolase [Afifella sp. IM 167]
MTKPFSFSEPVGEKRNGAIRPKPAATLIVLRREGATMRVLMGRRSDRHVFMPGKLVFPGGRVERADYRAPAASELDPEVEAKLALGTKRAGEGLGRALALAAIRETFEETGYLIGEKTRAARPRSRHPSWRAFHEAGYLPDLAPVRLVARAITPPGRPRRFDARFFVLFDDGGMERVATTDRELLDPRWLTFDEVDEADLPLITRRVLADLAGRLSRDPELSPGGSVPFHFMHYGRGKIAIL